MVFCAGCDTPSSFFAHGVYLIAGRGSLCNCEDINDHIQESIFLITTTFLFLKNYTLYYYYDVGEMVLVVELATSRWQK